MIAPDKWLGARNKADVTYEVRPIILQESAVRLLGVSE